MSVWIVVLGAAIIGPAYLVWRHEATTERAFERLLWIRKIVFGLLLVALAFTLLASGILWMVLLGGLLVALIWMYLLLFTDFDVDSPTEVLGRWTP